MPLLIIYNEDQTLKVVYPTNDIENLNDAVSLGNKVVPQGLPFKIIQDSEIPQNREYRDYWEISDSELTDGVGQ